MTVQVVVAEQPLASVTVKVYVPAARINVPVPVYGAVPPVAETTMLPLRPKQSASVATQLATSSGG